MEQDFVVVVPGSGRTITRGTRTFVLRAFPGGARDIREGYRFLFESPDREPVQANLSGPETYEELERSIGSFTIVPSDQLWVLTVPVSQTRLGGTLVSHHQEYGRDDSGAPCSVDVRFRLFTVPAQIPIS
jgi:hypothetical protein